MAAIPMRALLISRDRFLPKLIIARFRLTVIMMQLSRVKNRIATLVVFALASSGPMKVQMVPKESNRIWIMLICHRNYGMKWPTKMMFMIISNNRMMPPITWIPGSSEYPMPGFRKN